MFIHGFPYTDLSEINLDFILRKIEEVRDASGIKFDDTTAQISADNVQNAIEALKTLIDNVAAVSTVVVKIPNGIDDAFWSAGHSYTHLQTVENPTLMAIIDAVKEDKIIVLEDLEVNGSVSDTDFFYIVDVEEDSVNITHTVRFMDSNIHKIHVVEINGLNNEANVFVNILPDENTTFVNSFNGRSGDVLPTAGDYTASDVSYDNTVSGLTATDTQAAIDELTSSKQDTLTFDNTPTVGSSNPVTSDGIAAAIPSIPVSSVFNRTGAVAATSGDYDADQVDYDNTTSGLTATDVQAAIDEIANDILTSGVASFNGRTGAVNPASGDYNASLITTGTFPDRVNANATAQATLANSQIRNISAGTTDLTEGVSVLATGEIYIYYEP